MLKLGSSFLSHVCLITFMFSLLFGPFNLELHALTIAQNDKLIERIAKDFSRKFCNGIGFGLSEESALNFAMKENIEIFKKKKGIENINNKVLAEKVSTFVSDKCGYPINLSEEEWISSFE